MSTRLLVLIPVLLGGWLLIGVAVGQDAARATSTVVRDSVDHSAFDQVLHRFVGENGMVDYAGLKNTSNSGLAPYLDELAAADLSPLGRDQRLAFWINAYNALTLQLIVEHYPVENIWAVTPGPAEPKEDSPFERTVAPVADTARTLDEIEHDIIRERFDEPRIHFALVCAAKSCPPLRRDAYTAPRLDAQLDDQARTFLHNKGKNRIPAGDGQIALSRILKWYGEDFGPTTDALQKQIATYFEGAVRTRLKTAAYEVTFLPYDWSLNEQAADQASASGR